MARISEMHYSNAWASSTGIAEFLEVALSPGEDPADFSVGFYQHTGVQDIAISLTHPDVIVTVDPDSGETSYVISADFFPILLTDPNGGGSNNYEAYALVNTDTSTVVDFYDIGGGTQNITATNGIAQGATSTNVATPTGPNAATYTIQFNAEDPGTVVYEPISQGDTGVICFATGTEIETATGVRYVEDLRPGDRVLTVDHGPQPLVWTGARRVAAKGPFAPIVFAPGSIGNSSPLVVSPQHRMLARGWRAELMFGQEEILVAACHLVDGTQVRQIAMPWITYHHLMFDRHQIIRANGALAESFYPGAEALNAVEHAARQELFTLFPNLRHAMDFGPLARMAAKGRDAVCLLEAA